MKIFIIGPSGAGKSRLAGHISKSNNIRHFDLDYINYKGQEGIYHSKNTPAERNKKLSEILLNEDWIIEGVYYEWCDECFDQADVIILMNCSPFKCKIRIITRFIKRKLHIDNQKSGSFKELVKLLSWVDEYHDKDLPQIKEKLHHFKQKTIIM